MDIENARGLNKVLPDISEWNKCRIKNMGVKFYVGEEQRPSWSGKLPFYVFWCDDCENFSYDYPHSYIVSRYLLCHRCRANINFAPWWADLKMIWDSLWIWRQRGWK